MIQTGQLINGRLSNLGGQSYRAFDPTLSIETGPLFHDATAEEINHAADLAEKAFEIFRVTPSEKKAELLHGIAKKIADVGDELITTAHRETALPVARLESERVRTINQLKAFASYLVNADAWHNLIIDKADTERKPLPKPDIRQTQIPLGPVAVFGSSNFPLAFSVAGGDTAAALAAGCPVIYKVHPAHPHTSQLIGEAVIEALKESDLPSAVFSLIHGKHVEVGHRLVTVPAIKAVAFTGSFRGGMALKKYIESRAEPIPLFAEMGSVNPGFFLPAILRKDKERLGVELAKSVLLGTGQFCTNPGLIVLLEGSDSDEFIDIVKRELHSASLHPMLSSGIEENYLKGCSRVLSLSSAKRVTEKKTTEGVSPLLVRALVRDALGQPEYFEEIFGPAAVVLVASDVNEMKSLIARMPGQLTGSIYADEADYDTAGELAEVLKLKVGRLIFNGFPTGVEVCNSMVHSGPYPASTDYRTSVGITAMNRFLRPVCYQNFPDELLPRELKNDNPGDYFRMTDGKVSKS